MPIVEHKGRTYDGGSCSECGQDYEGVMAYRKPEMKGFSILWEDKYGIVEPRNVCEECYIALQ